MQRRLPAFADPIDLSVLGGADQGVVRDDPVADEVAVVLFDFDVEAGLLNLDCLDANDGDLARRARLSSRRNAVRDRSFATSDSMRMSVRPASAIAAAFRSSLVAVMACQYVPSASIAMLSAGRVKSIA